MKDSFTGLLIVAFAFWLLFLGGMEAISRATQGYAANGAPIVGAIQVGAQRVLATPAVVVQPVAPVAQAPLAVAQPAAPAAPQVMVVPLTSTPAPPTAIPPTATPAYPSADLEYEVVTVKDHGYEQQCVNVRSLNKRVCDAPGLVITAYKANLYAGYIEAGLVAGEPIP